MQYLGTPSSPEIRALMSAGVLGCMTTPAQGNRVPPGAHYACDNGKFGKGWPGENGWFRWLQAKVLEYGPELCLWATAPDVVGDAEATLEQARPWLPWIRWAGVPAAFVAQNGCTPNLTPWDDLDVLFLGGAPECLPCAYVRPIEEDKRKKCPRCQARLTEWKTSEAARQLVEEAHAYGKPVHMGRVNSQTRLQLADDWGCVSADGTYLARGPDKNLRRLLGWLEEINEGNPA